MGEEEEYKELKLWLEAINKAYSKFGKQVGDPDPSLYEKLRKV